MNFEAFLMSWANEPTAVVIHLVSGKELQGALSSLAEQSHFFQIEETRGQQTFATVFHGSDVVAVTLPAGRAVKKRSRP